MKILRAETAGIDIPIQKIQSDLYDRLLSDFWQIDESKFISYGRCYRNLAGGGGYVAECFTNPGYKEVYLDSSKSVVSFFGIGSKIERSGMNEKAEVHLVYFVNLADLKPSIAHRADEEIHKDVLSIIGSSMYGSEYLSLETGIVNVLAEYPGTNRDLLINADMFPWHCFRINFSLIYDIQQNCLPFKAF